KLDQSQYRELEAFSKYGSDLDSATKALLEKGARNVEILKQAQYSPVSVERQAAIIYLGTKGLLNKVPVNKVRDFEKEYLQFLETKHKDVLNQLAAGKIDESITSVLEAVAKELTAKYK